jgi:hypothetical protein
LLYFVRRDLPDKIAAGIRPLYELVRDKYRIDELYGARSCARSRACRATCWRAASTRA